MRARAVATAKGRTCPRMRAFAAFAGALVLLAGCSGIPRDYRASDAPRFDPAIGARCSKPCVALVLGAGGPRGFAHVGALKVLEREGIHPGMVVGASVGAMIGALYASGISAAAIERTALAIDASRFLQLTRDGFIGDARELQAYVNEVVGGRPLEALTIPVAVVAARERDLTAQTFTVGNTGVAVRASAATPGVFPVAIIRGERYVDGDEHAPVPIRIARSLGADVVIAIDVSAHLATTPPEAPAAWRARDRARAALIAREVPFADVFIHPDLGYYASVALPYRIRSIAIAERATLAAMPRIRAALAQAVHEATSSGISAAR